MIVTFYALLVDGKPFYVGKTTLPLKARLSRHRSTPTNDGTKNIFESGKDVKIRKIETVRCGDNNESLTIEKYYIEQFKLVGWPMTNGMSYTGGDKPDLVAVGTDRIKKLRDYKSKKGIPISFFVAQAIDNEFKRLESESGK